MTFRLAGVSALILAIMGATSPARAMEPSEQPVKAAFLYRFASFVAWPAGAFVDPVAPLNLCVVGHDPFGPVLDRAVSGQTVGARMVVVRRLAAIDAASGCHVAYLGGSEAQPLEEAARALVGAPVLTVTDGAGPHDRGAVNFVVRDHRLRFEIDQSRAASAGLSISSRLLNLAVEVVR